MKKIYAFTLVAASLAGCASSNIKPFASSDEGLEIVSLSNGKHSLKSYKKSFNLGSINQTNLEFCVVQNVSLSGLNPVLNPQGNRIAAQGGEQFDAVMPDSWGNSFYFNLFYKLTTSIDNSSSTVSHVFDDLKIKGAWSQVEAAFPGGQNVDYLINPAIDRMNSIIQKVNNCLEDGA